MNKTVTVNIGGIVFHIDENAYERFKQYLEAVRGHFSEADGRDEIMQDIESRIAEMFQERVGDSKQVITLTDVEEVTRQMGKPEDFGEGREEAAKETTPPVETAPLKRRLFREPDDKLLGGVCSGIASYLNIDAVWVRLAFAFIFFLFGDGRVDTETLRRFVAAYQTVTALKLGELWAIPIMLRLALIENLRRVGVRIAAAWDERHLANSWADRMTEAAGSDPGSLILVIADMARSNPPMVGAFVAELARRLQGRGPALVLPLNWIEQLLSDSGLTIEHLVQLENQQQASDQVSISNSIGSLRALGALDWRQFVETMSVVEQVDIFLQAGDHADMGLLHIEEQRARHRVFTLRDGLDPRERCR